ncbi:hypothetical protein CRYUN_Cryun33cG0065500 [Craigia yunnanensis]
MEFSEQFSFVNLDEAPALSVILATNPLKAEAKTSQPAEPSFRKNCTLALKIEAKDVSCFMYFMGINAIVSAYSFLVLLLPETSLVWRSILVSDVVAAVLMASINSATLGMFYMEMKGNTLCTLVTNLRSCLFLLQSCVDCCNCWLHCSRHVFL